MAEAKDPMRKGPRSAAGEELLGPLREKVRRLAHELGWMPERVAVITRELTEVETRLVAAGEGAQDGLAALGVLRRALHRAVRFHIEPAITGLEAAAGEGEPEPGPEPEEAA